MPGADSLQLDSRFVSRLHQLMPFKVRKVLFVSSLYDFFMLEEDGRLNDLLAQWYSRNEMGYFPSISQVSGGEKALEMLESEPFDLVVCMMQIEGMDSVTLGRKVKELKPDTPVAVLAYNTYELQRFMTLDHTNAVDWVFLWQGDGEVLLGIIQLAEDMKNAAHDSGQGGVLSLLLVEDNVLFYSRYIHRLLGMIRDKTSEIVKGHVSYSSRRLRAMARPKLLLATCYEEAIQLVDNYGKHLLGLFTDLRFPRDGVLDPDAGRHLIEYVRARFPGMPVSIQSSEEDASLIAEELGTGFVSKSSPTLLRDIGEQFAGKFCLGSLVFKDTSGRSITSVSNLEALSIALDKLPGNAVSSTLRSGEMTRWLRSHTELELADRLDILTEDSGAAGDELRREASRIVREYRRESYRGRIVPYSRTFYREYAQFSRIGRGSIGGKGRGLAFLDRVLALNFDGSRFRDVTVTIPRTLVLTSDIFDKFIMQNDLLSFAVDASRDLSIIRQFLNADLPPVILGDLRDFLGEVRTPLAVRSSSLLEDALCQPFAGIYTTKMLPNNSISFDKRFNDLAASIKFVYASTFFHAARSYIEATNHRIEEEKMAILIQEVAGSEFPGGFYPHFSGVGRSYNFYPTGSADPEDGVVNVALGLGKTIVDGGVSLRFTPKYPRILPQFGTIRSALNDSQRQFYAISMDHSTYRSIEDEDQFLVSRELASAETDGTLDYIASTYDADNDMIVDGINRAGPRVINFAHVLKNKLFPLAPLTDTLLKLGEHAMGCPVEIEFAVELGRRKPLPATFSLLQIRPMVVAEQLVEVDLGDVDRDQVFCTSDSVLGNGVSDSIHDIVYVRPESFDASLTRDIAVEIARMNSSLFSAGTPYILIGPGRWGSADSWLGIPVTWSQICGATSIVEVSLTNMNVEPSQGSHFFQNMTSLGVGYFSVSHVREGNAIDWDWLDCNPAVEETKYVRRIRLEYPVKVMIDGRSGRGVMLKRSSDLERIE